jgi:hypothetical protein
MAARTTLATLATFAIVIVVVVVMTIRRATTRTNDAYIRHVRC